MKRTFYYTFTVALFCLFSSNVLAFGASLSLSPSSAKYSVQDRVTVSVIASTDTPFNAISGTIKFPPQLFSIESISKADSVLNFWVSEPSFSRTTGVVKFEGVSLSGFTSGNANVIKINLRALKEGSANVLFESGQILANDGKGTDITGKLNTAVYTISPSERKVVVEEKEQKQEVVSLQKISAPVITLSMKDGLPAVSGISEYRNAHVVVTFISEQGSKVFITDTTNDKGEFVIIVPTLLKHGSYSVVAFVALKDGLERSLESNVITFTLKTFLENRILEILVLGSIFIIVVLAFTLLFSSLKKNKFTHKYPSVLKKEVKQAEVVMKKTFSFLRNDISALSQSNKSETEKMKELKQDLLDAESVIESEIKDIDKKL